MESEELYKEPKYGFTDDVLDDLFSNKPPMVLAGKVKRFANYLIDYTVISIFFLFVFVMMGGLISFFETINDSTVLTTVQDGVLTIVFLFGLLSYIYYFVIFEFYLDGKTLGKMMTSTKVVTIDGEQPSLMNIIGRTMCRYIPMEAFSFLLGNSGGLHDKLSNTIVIEDYKTT